MSSREKFLKLLKDDILKLDLADLDFGIYRILKYRRQDIENFLNQKLSALMAEALGSGIQERIDQTKNLINTYKVSLEGIARQFRLTSAFDGEELRPQLRDLPDGQDYLKEITELRELEANAGFTQSEEERMYNYLYTFFSRYYRDGDFLTQTRRSRQAKYSVPYNGEDVHFYWKSWDSHYVKTSEELRTYACVIGDRRVVFELRRAELEKDNVKAKTRYFIPLANQAAESKTDRTYIVPFEFRPLTEKEQTQYEGAKKKKSEDGENGNGTHSIQEAILKQHLDKLKKKPVDLDAGALFEHMRRYTRKNRTDYFVHRNLGEFLKSEFDYYLKNEFFDLEALTEPENLQDKLLKFKVLREIGHELCDLLDQIESYQARLFEKRKFVLGVNYLIPVRLLPSELIATVLSNEAQLQAWRDLFCLEADPITEETLQSHPTLVIDTRHFDAAFKQQVLATFDDIDEITDGVLINAENYAALRTVEYRFRNQVKAIYIDPPYNTGSDGFLYKDDFSRHSTWLSMMEERLTIAREVLAEDGVIFISIDDNEQFNLKQLADKVFGEENFVSIVIWQKVFSPKNTAKYFSEDHEYVLVYARNKLTWKPNLLPRSAKAVERYSNPDDDPRGVWSSSDLCARNYYSKGEYEVTSPTGKKFHNPKGTYWRISPEKFEELDQDNRIWWGEDGNNMPRLKRFLSDVKQGVVPQTLWTYKSVGHTQDAKKELLSIVNFERTADVLNTVKPINLIRRVLQIGTNPEEVIWVMDFFGGSGTTAHATMRQNSLDGGQRKFILIEMGDYFKTMTYQRVIRAMYAPEWKNGKPKFKLSNVNDSQSVTDELDNDDLPDPEDEESLGTADETEELSETVNETVEDTSEEEQTEQLPEWVERSPRLVKIFTIESYEDSLNALELPEERSDRILGQLSLFAEQEDYLIKYLLPLETEETKVLLNLKALEKPFEYCLRLHTPEGERDVPVDLVETFNLLMGFHVKRIRELIDEQSHDKRYIIVEALEKQLPVLVVWRNVADLNPERERQFLSEHFDLTTYSTIYTNADNALPNGRSLDADFKRRMTEPERRAV